MTVCGQFMHNGGIADFHKIKRHLQMSLPDEIYNWVNGNTGESYEQFAGVTISTQGRLSMGIRTALVEGLSAEDIVTMRSF